MEPHEWYDRIARFYDRSNGRRDRELRRRAAEELRLRAGDVVLVVGCGTGLDFPPIVPAVGPTGRVIGLDYSAGMLERARSLVKRSGWANVTLVHEDARSLGPEMLQEHAGLTDLDGLFFSAVLSIVPDWESVFERGLSLLRNGGRCVIFDIKPAAGKARIVNPLLSAYWKLGRADVRRPVAALLNGQHIDGLRIIRTRMHFVASGIKR